MKSKTNKKINILEIIFIIVIIIILVFILITNKDRNRTVHCKNAICNETRTLCYKYKVNDKGNTIKTWEGSCVK